MVPTYRLQSTAGADLGLLQHPAPSLEPGDIVELADGSQGLVTARIESNDDDPLVALLEVLIAPSSPHIPDPESLR